MKLKDGQLCINHPENLKRSKDGRCVKCQSERRMEYRARNLEKELARRAANRDRENELARKRHAENPEQSLERSRRYRERWPERVAENNRLQYRKNPELRRASTDKWRKANPEKVAVKNAAWRKANPDKIRETNRKQYAKSDKNKLYEQKRIWTEANREKARASVRKWNNENVPDRKAKKKAEQLKATPLWANDFFMVEAYLLARQRSELFGFNWQVDHIVPLIHKNVCGLHCEQNMQVIPAKLNAAKGNRWWPDMPNSKVTCGNC